MPFTGIAAAGLSALGGIAGGMMGSSKSYATSKKLWGWQNQYDKWLLNNQYQKMSQDLEKAGINPVLWAANGSPSPNAQSHTAAMPDMSGYNIGNAINTALNTYATITDIKNKTQQTEALTNNTNADTISKILNNNIVEKYGGKKAEQEIINLFTNSYKNYQEGKSKAFNATIQGTAADGLNSVLTWAKNKLNTAKKVKKEENQNSQEWNNAGEFYKHLIEAE